VLLKPPQLPQLPAQPEQSSPLLPLHPAHREKGRHIDLRPTPFPAQQARNVRMRPSESPRDLAPVVSRIPHRPAQRVPEFPAADSRFSIIHAIKTKTPRRIFHHRHEDTTGKAHAVSPRQTFAHQPKSRECNPRALKCSLCTLERDPRRSSHSGVHRLHSGVRGLHLGLAGPVRLSSSHGTGGSATGTERDQGGDP